MDYKDLWLQILKELEPVITRANIIAWFRFTTIIKYENNELHIGLPYPMYLQWHQVHYTKPTFEVAKKHLPDIKKVIYSVDLSLENDNQRTFDLLEHFPSKKKKQRKLPNKNEVKIKGGIISKILNPKYTFNTFVVGSNSRLAHAACMSVASKPGGNYNPLFLYGGVGLGKTHLLQATGNEIIRSFPSKTVAYITSEDFTNEVIEAIKLRKTDNLRKKYRQLDVLIIDDIQFIANKDRTQEEFFHTFNSLYQAGKQIILSSDRPPVELDILEERLRSRFSMGMIADISEPDYETRLAILQTKAQNNEVFLSNEVLEFMAFNVKQNVRELEGVLNQAIAQFELENVTPTVKSVMRILQSIKKDTTPVGFIDESKQDHFVKTFDELIDIVCEYFNVPRSEVLGASRLREYTLPRQIAMYLGKSKMRLAMTKIAETFQRDHTSVIHAVRKVEKELKNNRQIIRDMNAIKEESGLV